MKRKQIVVIGGGFGGMRLASDLIEKAFSVTLIDKNNYHQFQPLLYQVASSGLEASSICFPFRKIFNRKKKLTFLLAEVSEINSEKKEVITNVGAVPYDYLVVAAGTTTSFFGNDNLAKYTLPMKTTEEAMWVRNRILLQLEQLARTTDETERIKLSNLIIVGGGATGVEVAGVLSEMRRYVLPNYYPELQSIKLHIYLIESAPRLLGAMSDSASANALSFLESMGVEVLLNTRVIDCDENSVQLSNGDSLASSLIIWVSGVTANSIQGIPTESLGRANRILIDNTLQVKGMSNVYALGDIAFVEGDSRYPNGHPQVAQVAIQQGKLLASNLNNLSKGGVQHPFKYRDLGSLATVGRNKAVADLPKLHFSGFMAWIIWLFIHLRSILGVKNQLAVLLDWIWNYLSYNQSIRLLLFRGKR
ncbi:MAG: NAD(P)/FAD-dependent oxidoreductase [Phocaeicola sp.]